MKSKLPTLSTRKPRFDRMIAAIIKRYGVTQTELGKALDVSQSTINKLLTGEIQEPRYSVGVKIVQLYRG